MLIAPRFDHRLSLQTADLHGDFLWWPTNAYAKSVITTCFYSFLLNVSTQRKETKCKTAFHISLSPLVSLSVARQKTANNLSDSHQCFVWPCGLVPWRSDTKFGGPEEIQAWYGTQNHATCYTLCQHITIINPFKGLGMSWHLWKGCTFRGMIRYQYLPSGWHGRKCRSKWSPPTLDSSWDWCTAWWSVSLEPADRGTSAMVFGGFGVPVFQPPFAYRFQVPSCQIVLGPRCSPLYWMDVLDWINYRQPAWNTRPSS